MKLKIASDLSLPLDVVTQTFAVLALRRAGKTYTASVMAEEFMKAKLPFVALDPTGAWWGLRASADCKHEGFPVVIIGGAHGDVPLEPGAGKVLADMVVDHPGWYVIDLSQTDSSAEQDRIAQDFAERLYRRKTDKPFPMHLFVDEADSFAPQQAFPNQKRMLGAFEALVRRGGIRGIGTTLITQRPAVLNKNVLTQADNLIVLRVASPQDQGAIEDWIKAHGTKEKRDVMMNSLASLKQGEAWFWSPGTLDVFQRIQVRPRETFNSSATPKPGESTVEPQRLAPVDLEKLKDKIAATIEKAKADDPKNLRQRIAELERQLKRNPVPADPAVIASAVKEAEQRLALVYAENENKLRARLEEMRQLFDKVHAMTNLPPGYVSLKITPQLNGQPCQAVETTQHAVASQYGQSTRSTRTTPAPSRSSNGARPTTKTAEQKVLNSLAWWESLGIDQPSRAMVAFVAGYTVNGHFNNTVGGMRTGWLVEYPAGDCIALTDEGRALADAPDSPPTQEELFDRVRQKLNTAQRKLFDVLADALPDVIANITLATRAGYTVNGHFNNTRGSLRSLQLIEYAQGGTVLSGWLRDFNG